MDMSFNKDDIIDMLKQYEDDHYTGMDMAADEIFIGEIKDDG